MKFSRHVLNYFIKELRTSSPSAFAEMKKAAPKMPQNPYFGQVRSSARARLETQGTPVERARGIMVDRCSIEIMENMEIKSIML